MSEKVDLIFGLGDASILSPRHRKVSQIPVIRKKPSTSSLQSSNLHCVESEKS